MKATTLPLTLLVFGISTLQAQLVSEAPVRTIKCTKTEVTFLANSPKEDQVLVGLNKGAELYHLESGKRIHAFQYNEDGGTAVYHAAFNDNGEWVVLLGHTGKRTVWDVKSGKQDRVINPHRWIPDPRTVKGMGLDMSNSAFDRFYQQSQTEHNGITVRSGKHGAVEFLDGEGKVLQKLEYPENKDQHHRAPLLFWDKWFITGTDDGRVLFYEVL